MDGKTVIPQMYGDPRGYKQTGRKEWYHFTPTLHTNRLAEIYLWSMDRKDMERVPVEGWFAYLEGKDPSYPEKALRADLERLRNGVRRLEADDTTPDTRLADYVQGMNPLQHNALAELTTGAYLTARIWTFHARVRYFDAARQRPGLPRDVAPLAEKFDANSTTVSLVNTNPVESRTLYLQSGGFAEHQIVSASLNGQPVPVNDSAVRVKLAPGAGGQIVLQVKRYANEPTLRLPWQR